MPSSARFSWHLFALSVCGLVLGTTIIATPNPVTPPEFVLEVPGINQFYDYSCGAASLAAALNYYGVETDEAEMIKAAKTDKKFGTRLSKMAAVARKQGVGAKIKEGMTIEDLRQQVQQRQAVIIEAQAWPDDGKKVNYPTDWDDGHYLVVVGVDNQNVFFMDPSLIGSRGYIPIAEFLERWHDVTFKGRKAYNRGLVLNGTPKPPVAWVKIP